MTRGLGRRLNRVESALIPRQDLRIVVRYEGPGSERLRQPTEEEIRKAWRVLTVRFVAARDGRPS
jgi:hypothetical protein